MSRQTTPTLTDLLSATIDGKLSDLHTSLPGEIVSYDSAKNLAVVRPLLKRKYKNEELPVDLPTISNVPVCFPRMGTGHLRFPIEPKMTGLIQFSERSIDKWLVAGGSVDPDDTRKHSLSDATFWPGLNPNNDPIKSLAVNTSLELKLNGSYIEILANGKFKIKGESEELFDLLSQTLAKIISLTNELGFIDTTNTMFGPMQPNNFTAYQTLKQDFFQLKTKIDSLKG